MPDDLASWHPVYGGNPARGSLSSPRHHQQPLSSPRQCSAAARAATRAIYAPAPSSARSHAAAAAVRVVDVGPAAAGAGAMTSGRSQQQTNLRLGFEPHAAEAASGAQSHGYGAAGARAPGHAQPAGAQGRRASSPLGPDPAWRRGSSVITAHIEDSAGSARHRRRNNGDVPSSLHGAAGVSNSREPWTWHDGGAAKQRGAGVGAGAGGGGPGAPPGRSITPVAQGHARPFNRGALHMPGEATSVHHAHHNTLNSIYQAGHVFHPSREVEHPWAPVHGPGRAAPLPAQHRAAAVLHPTQLEHHRAGSSITRFSEAQRVKR